ncbi:hypothetical protein HKCCSP123_09130 [Rhodobacterales bacterium HKCCSP123]|nr:hypothetical protein [Rhodobacterales bacterium HKCCSP123]
MSEPTKLGFIVSAMAGLAGSALAQTSVTEGFAGWCLPAETQPVQDGRTGRVFDVTFGLSVTPDGYEMSYEEGGYCAFSNPTDVPGLDARVFDAVCDGADGMDVGADGRAPFRAMIATVEDPNTFETKGILIEPGRLVELSPCLELGWSNTHAELGYDLGYRQPNLATPDVRYLAELLHWRWGTGGTYVNGRLQEAIGLEPNFAGRYIIGTMGGCGTDCSVPFIFDTRDGTEIELSLSADPDAEYGNVSFSMVNDNGSLMVSWRDDACVRQEFALAGNALALLRETRTPHDPTNWSGYPLHCPAAGEVTEDVTGLASDVRAALGPGGPGELAPVASFRPRVRPTSGNVVTGSFATPVQGNAPALQRTMALSSEERGALNFAGICIGHAEEGNAILRRRGASSDFNQIIAAAERSIAPILRRASDGDAYSEFTSWRNVTRQQLAGYPEQGRIGVISAFLQECFQRFGP